MLSSLFTAPPEPRFRCLLDTQGCTDRRAGTEDGQPFVPSGAGIMQWPARCPVCYDRSMVPTEPCHLMSVFFLAMTAFLALGPPSSPLEHLGRFDLRVVPEASGIVKSRRHPGIFWVHNDSGNSPTLFAIRRDGTIVREFHVAVPNVDWEDIASDGEGHLYVAKSATTADGCPCGRFTSLTSPTRTGRRPSR